MKPKTMILMVVAIVCGLGASYMTSRLLAERDEQPQQQPAPEPAKVKILVAKTNLDHGAAIKEPKDLFVEKTFAAEDAPKDGLTDIKVLKDKFLKRHLRKNDHVTLDDLMDEKTSLLAKLPDGYRGVGVTVTNDATASGFASLPGSKVDILWTVKSPNDDNTFVKILLIDVLVLAADTKTERDPDGKAMLASIVTLALNQSDCMKIDLAKRYGSLTFALRRFGDTTPAPEQDGLTYKQLLGAERADKKDKKSPTEVDEFGDPVEGGVVPVLPGVKKDETEKPAVAPPPVKKRYYHYVHYRQGDKTWKQQIEVDVNGNPVGDEAQQGPPGDVPPALQPSNPTVGAQPVAPAQEPAPAGKKD